MVDKTTIMTDDKKAGGILDVLAQMVQKGFNRIDKRLEEAGTILDFEALERKMDRGFDQVNQQLEDMQIQLHQMEQGADSHVSI